MTSKGGKIPFTRDTGPFRGIRYIDMRDCNTNEAMAMPMNVIGILWKLTKKLFGDDVVDPALEEIAVGGQFFAECVNTTKSNANLTVVSHKLGPVRLKEWRL